MVNKDASILHCLIYGFIGAIGLYFSHTAVFILSAIVLVQMSRYIQQKNWMKFRRFLFTYYIWGIIFMVNYLFLYS